MGSISTAKPSSTDLASQPERCVRPRCGAIGCGAYLRRYTFSKSSRPRDYAPARTAKFEATLKLLPPVLGVVGLNTDSTKVLVLTTTVLVRV